MFLCVHIQDSLAPAACMAALEQSLRSRDLAHKFLYESPQQARRWLEVHEQYSPARQDGHGVALYAQASAHVAAHLKPGPAIVIGLGCGGGQKDVAVLKELQQTGHEATYVPLDASVPLVLTAANRARTHLPGLDCRPVVADLTAAADLPDLLAQITPPGQTRLFTFYGILHNLEPEVARAILERSLRPGDRLLLSANLAPGEDYPAGVRQILPQYDNPAMREWLLTWPGDIGFDLDGTNLRFDVATQAGPLALLRIDAHLFFNQHQQIAVEGQSYSFKAGDSMRLFFSYRYTPQRVRELLRPIGLGVTCEWITPSGEEGIFAVG